MARRPHEPGDPGENVPWHDEVGQLERDVTIARGMLGVLWQAVRELATARKSARAADDDERES